MSDMPLGTQKTRQVWSQIRVRTSRPGETPRAFMTMTFPNCRRRAKSPWVMPEISLLRLLRKRKTSADLSTTVFPASAHYFQHDAMALMTRRSSRADRAPTDLYAEDPQSQARLAPIPIFVSFRVTKQASRRSSIPSTIVLDRNFTSRSLLRPRGRTGLQEGGQLLRIRRSTAWQHHRLSNP